jgi:hypothetical protein
MQKQPRQHASSIQPNIARPPQQTGHQASLNHTKWGDGYTMGRDGRRGYRTKLGNLA